MAPKRLGFTLVELLVVIAIIAMLVTLLLPAVRTGFSLPRRDRSGLSLTKIYGSAHESGFNMAYCDGHVEHIAYDIDLFAHRAASHRNDGGDPTMVGMTR